ncbi:hypothetical protein NCC78_13800 [Micromonospora phytophila]|uniref:hypothetical protein n=1 Tax=Micromonospora phytophila TaxID=709888 RepID=UPI00202F1DB8|nr:hypothetical protein [Micromonospora phytophila]MCM0675755.1 hypothetical protein [Micromonospora phytophila]
MSLFRFSSDQFRLPLFHVEDKKYEPLGAWLITDISTYMLVCLDALAMIDDVAHGRAPFEEWSSENYDVAFTPEGVSVRNQWVETEQGTYSVDEVREALEEYWSFLRGSPENPDLVREFRPDLPQWQAALLRWEEKWGLSHPYRGRLF